MKSTLFLSRKAHDFLLANNPSLLREGFATAARIVWRLEGVRMMGLTQALSVELKGNLNNATIEEARIYEFAG